MLHLVKPLFILKHLFNDFLWDIPSKEKKLYLTFDDGPHGELTPWIIDLLSKYHAKATFFLVGKNALKHPNLHQLYLKNGHRLGNHTFQHLKAWSNKKTDHLDDIAKCAKIVESDLFRPPHGQVKLSAIKEIKKKYRIVMWDVLSWDFDEKIEAEECLLNVTENAKEGSIIVFHENEKAKKNLQYALPKILEYYSKLGYTFEAIPKR